MRVTLVVCVVAALALLSPAPAEAGALVCSHRYCKEHPCTAAPVSDASCRAPATFRQQHSGKCGCCPACVTLLEKGAACKTYSKELGETPSAVCKEGMRCVNGKCEQLSRA